MTITEMTVILYRVATTRGRVIAHYTLLVLSLLLLLTSTHLLWNSDAGRPDSTGTLGKRRYSMPANSLKSDNGSGHHWYFSRSTVKSGRTSTPSSSSSLRCCSAPPQP